MDNWTVGSLLESVAKVPESLATLPVKGLSVDSRQLQPGALFIALSGAEHDGMKFREAALKAGAVAILQAPGMECLPQSIEVENLAQQLGKLASRFYGAPSTSLQIAAVTGTDGKSSVTHFIAAAMEQIQGGAAVIGTLGNRLVSGQPLSDRATHTTPPPITLQQLLAKGLKLGVQSVALEASSHGLEQGRLSGLQINTAVLTQLGRDHLDYHGSEAAYRAAKRALFEMPSVENIVVNLDDGLGREIAAMEKRRPVISYSLQDRSATLYGAVVSQDQQGLMLEISYEEENDPCRVPLYGRFNASNLLATLGTLLSWEVPLSDAIIALSQLKAVAGRMEPFASEEGPLLVVDYAHTPGALAAALQAVREHLQQEAGKLWVLFGCGGDRDRGKRPEMGQVAAQWADRVVVTSDNPRSEPPMQIIEEIIAGITQKASVTCEVDRAAAIQQVWEQASPDDVVLIAGKGHETTQTIGDQVIPWSDRDVAAALTNSGSIE